MNQLALGCAALLLAGVSYSQTTTTYMANGQPTIRDNPGTLGHQYADLNYSWVDYHRDAMVDADGYVAGLSANAPLTRGIDLGFGYNYYRENHHRNPFTNSPYDARYHGVDARGTFFAPVGNARPFVTGGVGYQWSRGDIQSLRTYDHEWTWTAIGGVELGLGPVAVTPRIGYSDFWRSGSIGAWQYGAQVHHWFNEKFGGYVDAAFHDPRHGGPEYWTYTAGVRLHY